ncbi:MAG: hypothetical protein ACRDZR_02925 [Acidimicrobiales bacterium]
MTKFRPGMQVEVPFGMGVKRGTVVDAFGRGQRQIVSVRITLVGDVEEPVTQEIGFPAEWVHPVVEPAAS